MNLKKKKITLCLGCFHFKSKQDILKANRSYGNIVPRKITDLSDLPCTQAWKTAEAMGRKTGDTSEGREK